MLGTTLKQTTRTMAAVVMAALLTACAEVSPTEPAAVPDLSEATALARRAPNLGACDSLAAPDGHRVSVRTFARGVQIYRWNGASWAFVAPEADLYANRHSRREIGTHYAGPTWESRKGSKVVGAVSKRCTPTPAAIPWLLLTATPTLDRGMFAGTTFIQRVNTVGGLAPVAPGMTIGQEVRVPYTTDYYFYRVK